jgi:peptide/nickel transport system substrate-binding protein
MITSWKPNQEYVLQRFPGYWGPAPAVPTINIPVVPDITTQQLELNSGEVDMIVHGLTPQQISPYEHNSKFTISSFASLQATMLVINPNRGAFANSQLRAALVAGIDRTSLTSEVFANLATPANEIYPTSMLSGTGGVEPAYQPGALAAAVRATGSSGKKVEIGYDISDPFNGRVAGVLGADLEAAGLSYTSVGIPDAQTYALPSHPQSAPDVLIVTTNPDAGHPDTWVRIYMSTNGSTNYLSCSVPAADKEMDAGLAAIDPQAVEQDYETVGNLLVQSNCWDVIANVNDTVVARSGITGMTHQLPANATVIFADLRATA